MSIDPGWRRICTRIGQFCLRAGSPSANHEPYEDITGLRLYVLSRESQSREASLHAEVERLKDLCRTQQRIITNLTFRHTLEALPGPRLTDPRGNPTLSSTAHWRRFWNNAWHNVQRQASENHPLWPLLQRFDQPTQRQIQVIGGDLYGTLSTNIHHFSGEFAVNEDQWDVLQAAILHSLTPTTARRQDGSVNWDLERQRY